MSVFLPRKNISCTIYLSSFRASRWRKSCMLQCRCNCSHPVRCPVCCNVVAPSLAMPACLACCNVVATAPKQCPAVCFSDCLISSQSDCNGGRTTWFIIFEYSNALLVIHITKTLACFLSIVSSIPLRRSAAIYPWRSGFSWHKNGLAVTSRGKKFRQFGKSVYLCNVKIY